MSGEGIPGIKDVLKLTVSDLKGKLRKAGLPTTGKKVTLAKRYLLSCCSVDMLQKMLGQELSEGTSSQVELINLIESEHGLSDGEGEESFSSKVAASTAEASSSDAAASVEALDLIGDLAIGGDSEDKDVEMEEGEDDKTADDDSKTKADANKKGQVKCELCGVVVLNEEQYQRHVKGKRHEDNDEFNKNKDNVPLIKLNDELDDKEGPFIGLEYIEEIQYKDSPDYTEYECKLCEIKRFPEEQFYSHVQSQKHMKAFLVKHYLYSLNKQIRLEIDPPQKKVTSKVALAAIIRKMCHRYEERLTLSRRKLFHLRVEDGEPAEFTEDVPMEDVHDEEYDFNFGFGKDGDGLKTKEESVEEPVKCDICELEFKNDIGYEEHLNGSIHALHEEYEDSAEAVQKIKINKIMKAHKTERPFVGLEDIVEIQYSKQPTVLEFDCNLCNFVRIPQKEFFKHLASRPHRENFVDKHCYKALCQQLGQKDCPRFYGLVNKICGQAEKQMGILSEKVFHLKEVDGEVPKPAKQPEPEVVFELTVTLRDEREGYGCNVRNARKRRKREREMREQLEQKATGKGPTPAKRYNSGGGYRPQQSGRNSQQNGAKSSQDRVRPLLGMEIGPWQRNQMMRREQTMGWNQRGMQGMDYPEERMMNRGMGWMNQGRGGMGQRGMGYDDGYGGGRYGEMDSYGMGQGRMGQDFYNESGMDQGGWQGNRQGMGQRGQRGGAMGNQMGQQGGARQPNKVAGLLETLSTLSAEQTDMVMSITQAIASKGRKY